MNVTRESVIADLESLRSEHVLFIADRDQYVRYDLALEIAIDVLRQLNAASPAGLSPPE